MDISKIILLIVSVWNIYVFFLYGFDKMRAKKEGRRIRERTLIICSYAFGSVGAMFGMVVFNHKTAKPKFRAFVPLSVILNFTIIILLRIYIF